MPRTQHGNPDQQQQHHSFHAQPLPSRHLQHQLQQHQPPQLHQHLQHHKVPQHHEHQLPHFPQHAPQRLQDLPQTPGIATTHVGKYTLYTKIGEGAFGKVKLGINRDTKELVAVKIMDKKEIREQNLSVQVRCEIYIMRSLLHKHIVRMYELITSDTKLYFVMEFVTGGELFERLGKDAIKILDKKDIKANELTVNVRREIAIMKALNHKNIVNLREVLSSKSKLYIVMDLVRGGELFEMINRKGELDEKLARSYFEQLVDGIDYCHRRGVLHRDLKPENLLVDEKGTLMITEFGVSSMKGGVAGSDILYTACGTPYYCALEIFNGAEEGYKGVKIDAWSCGIILYLLLTGSLPFINEDITHLYDQINRCIVNYPNWMSPDAIDLVSHLLRKDPNLRYSLDDLTRHPWFLVNYESADSEAEISPSGVGGPLPTKTSGKSSSTGFGSGEKFTGLVDVGVRFFVKENEHPGRREGMSSPVTAQTTSHGGSSQSSVPTPVDSSPVMKNNDTDIAVLYGDRPLSDLVKDALPGKPQKKINDVVARLEEIYVDCFDDVQLLTKTLGFLERLTAWLEDQSKLPSVTCMRLSKFFFAP